MVVGPSFYGVYPVHSITTPPSFRQDMFWFHNIDYANQRAAPSLMARRAKEPRHRRSHGRAASARSPAPVPLAKTGAFTKSIRNSSGSAFVPGSPFGSHRRVSGDGRRGRCRPLRGRQCRTIWRPVVPRAARPRRDEIMRRSLASGLWSTRVVVATSSLKKFGVVSLPRTDIMLTNDR